jgi:hypothetical protein
MVNPHPSKDLLRDDVTEGPENFRSLEEVWDFKKFEIFFIFRDVNPA